MSKMYIRQRRMEPPRGLLAYSLLPYVGDQEPSIFKVFFLTPYQYFLCIMREEASRKRVKELKIPGSLWLGSSTEDGCA